MLVDPLDTLDALLNRPVSYTSKSDFRNISLANGSEFIFATDGHERWKSDSSKVT
jgi:hypothetical protein